MTVENLNCMATSRNQRRVECAFLENVLTSAHQGENYWVLDR